jgi:hypothetical protein
MKALLSSRSIAFFALLLLAGCATTGHPCFSDRVMYTDRSTACHYGRSYRCENGDWIAFRRSCVDTAPTLTSPLALNDGCEYAGVSYANGSASCNAGRQYRCDSGRWRSLDLPCSVGDAPFPVLTVRGAPCSYGGSSFASSSAICQSGTTFLCSNGEWINLGTVCR